MYFSKRLLKTIGHHSRKEYSELTRVRAPIFRPFVRKEHAIFPGNHTILVVHEELHPFDHVNFLDDTIGTQLGLTLNPAFGYSGHDVQIDDMRTQEIFPADDI
jgi:hypothetical protein